MSIQYIPGQRWVSNTESELGLGIVMDIANRRVTISFPAVGQRRTYAIDNAPLSRVHYEVGETIISADGSKIIVSEVQDQGGYLTYIGIDQSCNEVSLEEIDLESFVQFSRPQDRLFAGQIDKNSKFELRVETLFHLRRHQQASSFGLLGPRVQLLPHQLYIADKISGRHAPRVLLADEVGLGKTIEAGLVLHKQLITGSASRIFVIVPDSLVHQWFVEMSRRFNMQFTILDEERCMALEEGEHGNPFDSAQLVLCALSWLAHSQIRLEQALSANWDILVVDEAHHLRWTSTEVSSSYACVEALAKNIPSLLLLTATPEQLGIDGHFARLRLLDPDRYYDLRKFQEEEENYQAINTLVQKLLFTDVVEELQKNSRVLNELERFLGSDAVNKFKDAQAGDEANKALNIIIQNILDRHGTGRVLFRNTREAVEGFPQRKLITYALVAPELYTNKITAAEPNVIGDTKNITELLCPELTLGKNWFDLDPRVEWLAKLLQNYRDDKVLVICALTSTAKVLEEYLRVNHGIHSAVFHEELDLIARDRASAYFADEEGAQVLICSEIGSEGRNFQFSHHLVLFDLPLNPDLLEQRIGRLDRIGQMHTVQIHVPYYEDQAQAVLLHWYHKGLNAFQKVCSIGQTIYQHFQDQLKSSMLNCFDKDGINVLINETKIKSEDLLNLLQEGRDKLLELNSCNQQVADEIVNSILESSNQLELANYMERVCDQFGVDHHYHSAHSVVLQPGDHMHEHNFPGLPEGGITATYDRAKALIREDMQFHTWEHPMVMGAMDLILSGEIGNTSLCTIKLQSLKPGTILLEAIFLIHCAAPSHLQLHHYLPITVIRIVTDQSKSNLSKILTIEHLNRMAERVKGTTGKDIIRHARKQISGLIKNAEDFASQEKDEVIEQAIQKMDQLQSVELNRLIALSKVNPNIRKEEIMHSKTNASELKAYIKQAQLKLDAVRVVIARK